MGKATIIVKAGAACSTPVLLREAQEYFDELFCGESSPRVLVLPNSMELLSAPEQGNAIFWQGVESAHPSQQSTRRRAMGEFRKAKRPGPLPMHQAIRAAKFSRKFDELMARDRALEKQHEVNLRVLKAWANADGLEAAGKQPAADRFGGTPDRAPAACLQQVDSGAMLLPSVTEKRGLQ